MFSGGFVIEIYIRTDLYSGCAGVYSAIYRHSGCVVRVCRGVFSGSGGVFRSIRSLFLQSLIKHLPVLLPVYPLTAHTFKVVCMELTVYHNERILLKKLSKQDKCDL